MDFVFFLVYNISITWENNDLTLYYLFIYNKVICRVQHDMTTASQQGPSPLPIVLQSILTRKTITLTNIGNL